MLHHDLLDTLITLGLLSVEESIINGRDQDGEEPRGRQTGEVNAGKLRVRRMGLQ
jgi:hypothetical protein